MDRSPQSVINTLRGPRPANTISAYSDISYVVTHTRSFTSDDIQSTLDAAKVCGWLTAKQKRSLIKLNSDAMKACDIDGEGETDNGCPDCFSNEYWEHHGED